MTRCKYGNGWSLCIFEVGQPVFLGGFYHVLPNVLWGSGVDIVCYTAGFIGDMGSHGGFWVVAVEGYSMVPNFGRL